MAEPSADLGQVARRALPLLDLTSLNDNDDDAAVAALCNRAVTSAGHAAAVCIWPRFITLARGLLEHSGVRIAAVANFPAGGDDLVKAVRETQDVVNQGGDEVDLVMPYKRWLAGETKPVQEMIAACKAVCGDRVMLKVILETGRLEGSERIRAASLDAIEAGADFIKTSTGKVEVSATLQAAEAMLTAIRESGQDVGFKAAGGIRDTATAGDYLALADNVMGADWVDPLHFRFGASGLLDDLQKVLGLASGPAAARQGY